MAAEGPLSECLVSIQRGHGLHPYVVILEMLHVVLAVARSFFLCAPDTGSTQPHVLSTTGKRWQMTYVVEYTAKKQSSIFDLSSLLFQL